MFESMIASSLTIAALGAGLVAGVYFAFSAFIMRSFDLLGPARATDAMNAINDVILRSWFMVLFFGSTLLYAGLAAVAVFDPDLAGRWLLFTAGLIYVVGMFGCTAVFNVPLNNRLARVGSDESARVATWKHYLVHWTRWNHLRGVCSLATLVMSIHYLANYA
ncbi:MAG: DUF1772 domain-containing protein [Gammaproteobacteria bacterium]|jgi:uncharacterized membrane protein|nr:DUF1772 domain-containing protein [Gammaproteobacteria bacterium]